MPTLACRKSAAIEWLSGRTVAALHSLSVQHKWCALIGPSTTQSTQISSKFEPLLQQERDLLEKTANLGPLHKLETANEAEYFALLGSLLAQSGARYVVDRLYKQHQEYVKTFSPRLETVTTRVRNLRSAIRRARKNMKRISSTLGPPVADSLSTHILQLAEADKTMRGVGKGVARHLNSILRRGKRNRLFLDSLHALFILAVFTLGFGWVGDSVCTWGAKLLQQPFLPQRACLALWGVVTILLFAMERWFLGPLFDARLETRIVRSTEIVLGFYFVERTRLEYRMAILEHETDRMKSMLEKHNLL